MRMSPRLRRLRSDQKAMEQLRAESRILEYIAPGPMFGGPPETYTVRFHGLGVCTAGDSQEIQICRRHEVLIRLGASYPRMMPELIWKTPIFHPNISANGVVCLGGYSTHWVPSLQLDELCTMLWDMIRYENFDVDSPYNRAAAQWAREQTTYALPLDRRTLRDAAPLAATDDAVAAAGTSAPDTPWPCDAELQLADDLPSSGDAPCDDRSRPEKSPEQDSIVSAEIVFMDEEVVEAEIVEADSTNRAGAEILFIE
jgi:hypothetical protein